MAPDAVRAAETVRGAEAVRVAGALNACQRFLLRSQDPDGSWSDWDLPPGPSDRWTTAYVGLRLASADEPLRYASAAARRAAAAWLIEHESPGGGWAYNERVGPDADSTACALLFLSGEGVVAQPASWERLRAFQLGDGGFSTYRADEGLGSWGRSHPEVTVLAARALLSTTAAADAATVAIGGALRYVAEQRRRDGTWSSFWWSSPLYATNAALALLRASGTAFDLALTRTTLSRIDTGNAFERALMLSCQLEIGTDPGSREAIALVDTLVAEQLPDGSWPSNPILRLTDRDCCEPPEGEGGGPLFADPKRLFTSATVFGALRRFAGNIFVSNDELDATKTAFGRLNITEFVVTDVYGK